MMLKQRGQYQRVQCQSFVLLYVLWLCLGWFKSIELLTAGCNCVAWAETDMAL